MCIANFMRVFMFLLEKELNLSSGEISTVSFQSDEANVDRAFKTYAKSKILGNLKQIPSQYHDHELVLNGECKERILISTLSTYTIDDVYLPDEIPQQARQAFIAERGDKAYTNPDLLLKINHESEIFYRSIELKSTKTDAIPGSSVQQVDPYEWVLFVKHNGKSCEFTTGQYIHAINAKLQFPDRSPRPQVSFNELKSWNAENRQLKSHELVYLADGDEQCKFDLLNDWQGVLSQRWIDLLFNEKTIKAKEPWFNNNMRRFITEFLDKYESLSDEEKLALRKQIKTLIK